MNTLSKYSVLLVLLMLTHCLMAQESYKEKITFLLEQKERITLQEKDALKQEVAQINTRLDREDITQEEAKQLKEAAAKKRAMNIEDRHAIIDNKIALLDRNNGEVLSDSKKFEIFEDGVGLSITVNDEPWMLFEGKNKIPKYDRRTYSDMVIAIGLNNAVIEGQSLNDSPYKIGGSRFFELGWAWRTRVFNSSNFMRINYGFSFQFNGLKPDDNQYFVENNGQTELQEFEFDLNKSKLRMDNLVFPLHFEFGPSKMRRTEDKIRYSIQNQFRIGLGGYGGFNIGTRQKLKYKRAGDKVEDKFKRSYNTNDLIYGLSAYLGFDGVLLYAKYDLNPIFKDAVIEQRNVSLGLRFDL
ncbi:MAG: PorT family protein [Eudoraea sp.]|nr:PorT family protein [Eudoraea sp.]